MLLAALALATCSEVAEWPESHPPFGILAPATFAMSPEDIYVGVAFSGGGHRATAFALGVLEELRNLGAATSPEGMAGRIRFVSGVSGGAVIGTWFALHGVGGLDGFRERYLLSDGERYLVPYGFDTDLIARGLNDGVNPPSAFARALDETLFHGATFAALDGQNRVTLRIVASDIAGAAPFVFDDTTFGALCRALSRQPLSMAIAASAAFPVVFSPVVIEAGARPCAFRPSPGLAAALGPGPVHSAMRLMAQTVDRYADPETIQSVGLLDGFMTDKYGASGFLAARADGGVAPMTPQEAVRVRRILFLAVDAAHENWAITDMLLPTGRLIGLTLWGHDLRQSGDGGGDLEPLLARRAITATTTNSMATLESALTLWKRQIVDWRCALSEVELDTIYPDRPTDWDCRDLDVFVAEIGPDTLPDVWHERLEAVPTRLALSVEDVDAAIAAGHIALRNEPTYAAFLRGIGAGE